MPYELDPWTGSIAPIATYAAEGGRIRTEISFAPSEAMLIAIRPSRRAADVHVTGTTADSAVAVDGELAIRARSDGRYTTTLSDGRTVKTTIAGLPEPVDLARWELAVDEYRPGSAGDPSSHTEHVHWRFDDVALTPWSEIPEITDAVGVGTYTTAVRLPRRWTQRNGAYLALGALHGSFRVRVNGRSVGVVDQLADEVDIGPHLRAGTNRIEVEVATTMINRLRVFRLAGYGSQAKQDYGLIGPVTLTP